MVAVFTGMDEYDAFPSARSRPVVEVKGKAPESAVTGYLVPEDGELPDAAGVDRAGLETIGFEGKPAQSVALPGRDGRVVVLVGVGGSSELDASRLRDAAALFARATQDHGELVLVLGDLADVAGDLAGQALVEGVLLARYRYDTLKSKPSVTPVTELTLVVDGRAAAVKRGAARGVLTAEATNMARDLANGPPALLTATAMAEAAVEVGEHRGLDVEVHDLEQLIDLGCGGLLGVNAGSAEEPRMVKLSYAPSRPRGHLTLVGKGITYDAGGLALKPADEVHATMKNDMSGAGAILAAMLQLEALGCKTAVTGYLMCTDNRPSGTSIAMGDVLTVYGGKTVEVKNTDAEGRLVMADALVLATEEKTDAIVDIATLTGAAMRALGTQVAAVIGNDADIVSQIESAASATGESVWELPLERRYRGELDSDVADIKNLGGPNAGSITAALFLEEFVGAIPWAHIDIAGTAQNDRDTSWRPPGCTGFGARLLVDFAMNFKPPKTRKD
jgi:leucyl aminopeptidase